MSTRHVHFYNRCAGFYSRVRHLRGMEGENGMVRTPSGKGAPSGILRLDSGKPRRTSLELKHFSQLSSTAKVERWFEMLEPPISISRPESGFVSCQDQAEEEDEEERAILEGTKSLLSKLSARKQRKLLGLKLGKVTTF